MRCRPLTGAWIETLIARGNNERFKSPPHGGVDRNRVNGYTPPEARGRPLTGAWIETSTT